MSSAESHAGPKSDQPGPFLYIPSGKRKFAAASTGTAAAYTRAAARGMAAPARSRQKASPAASARQASAAVREAGPAQISTPSTASTAASPQRGRAARRIV